VAKARICWANVALESATSVAASASATGYAATNLLNDKRSLPWRSSTTTGDQTVTFSFSARTIHAVFLLNALIHAGGSVKVEYKNGGGGYAALDGGTGVCTFPSPNRTNLTGLYKTAGVTATDIRITFTNTGAVSAYVQLGLAFIADSAGYFTATVNVTDALGLDQIDPSIERVALGGQKFFRQLDSFIRFAVQFQWIPSSQQDSMLAIRDAVGRRQPVIFAVDHDDLNKTVYARLIEADFGSDHGKLDQWHRRFVVEEAL
jgi:hypothetical protein